MEWRGAGGLVEYQRKRRAASVGVEGASDLVEYQRKRKTSVGVEEGWWSIRVPEEEEGS